eukprot:TRINITY_DN940_c0_g1_i1.p1 TRINITY_DN940_c0_g1~~TRINITY_DN940_c0_g1_i1.p1  ORF type:complete len:137 (+),score=40.41 TRINITY_DN940_c0_g1_i1:69-479(+)
MSEAKAPQHPKNFIAVSLRKPVFFYVNLVKRIFATESEVQICGIASAITPAITVSEILRSHNIATITKVQTSLVPAPEGEDPHFKKACITIYAKLIPGSLDAAEVADAQAEDAKEVADATEPADVPSTTEAIEANA